MAEAVGEWDKTRLVEERMKEHGAYDEPSRESRYGEYAGRHVIGRDCRINGGVYLGGGEREAIVVDDKKYGELGDTYDELLRRREKAVKEGGAFKAGILTDVYELTMEKLPYRQDIVDDLVRDYGHDHKVSLTTFMNRGGGVCRHQALLAAYLLERLKDEGKINGKVSVDRNYVEGKGGHAWVRYENSAGTVFIIDPAQHYAGRLDDAGEDQWFYERPSTVIDRVKKVFKRLL